MYRIYNWINEGSGWIVKLIESQCIKISSYRPLPGSCYIKVPAELKIPKKGLINVTNKIIKQRQRCFLWCHVRYINPGKTHPGRIKQTNKKLANDLDYDEVGFPLQEKDFSKIETENDICINVYCYENKLTIPNYNFSI